MAAINQVGNALTGSTGTGAFVGANSPTLVTPTLGVATATSLVFNPSTGGIIGTTTNNNTTAGYVGEYVETVVASGSAVSLTTNIAANVATLSLTAGDWDVFGNVINIPAVGTSITTMIGSISATTATLEAGSISGRNVQTATIGTTFYLCPNVRRFSLSGTTTVYLVALSTFTAGTNTVYGFIGARRRR